MKKCNIKRDNNVDYTGMHTITSRIMNYIQ